MRLPQPPCHHKTYFWVQPADLCRHCTGKPTAEPRQERGSPHISPQPPPAIPAHPAYSLLGLKCQFLQRERFAMQFLCQASKPAGCTSPLGFYEPPGSQDRWWELGRAARDASELLSAGRAHTEANLSSKSQCKTIRDSRFFIKTSSTRQPPVTDTVPTSGRARLFFRGCSGPPPYPLLRVSWGSCLVFSRI